MSQANNLAAAGVVVGMQQLTGEVGKRVDIDVLLVSQPDTFNLFLQALASLQEDPKLLGYYALAGIHGLPSSTWDDVNKKFRDAFGGYCAHGVLVFPTWHRPYISLVEQTIYRKMVDIANAYDPPHRQKYLDAAKKFRLPYLDYFRPRDGAVTFAGVAEGNRRTSFPYNFRLPDILNEKKVTLRLPPQDTLKYDIDNPLYTYKFTKEHGQLPTNDQDAINGSFSTTQTVRWPSSLSSTTHGLGQLSNSLNSGREGRNSLALDLLYSEPYKSLGTVASNSLEGGDVTAFRSDTASGSLEGSIHGAYHNLIGGRGHMATPLVAAFDPVFWFHHCQVDRLWALWQAFHPKSWFPSPAAGQQPENLKDLLPFYKSRTGPGNGTFYNSDDTKKTESFGYIYDDFEGIQAGDNQALRTKVDNKYIWQSRTPRHPSITDPPADMRPLNVRSTYFFSKAPRALAAQVSSQAVSNGVPETAGTIQAVADGAQKAIGGGEGTATASKPVVKIDPTFDREWYVDSIVKRSAANGPFTIYFFLAPSGEVTTDPSHYIDSPYLAGITHIFTSPVELCDNCGDQNAAGVKASDTVPITPLLLDYLDLPDNGLDSLKPEHVKPFLVKYLRWRVVYGGTVSKDPREVPDLTVSVSAKVYHEDGTKTYEVYPEVVNDILHNASPTAGA